MTDQPPAQSESKPADQLKNQPSSQVVRNGGDETGGKETAHNSNGAEQNISQSVPVVEPAEAATAAPANTVVNAPEKNKLLNLLRGFNDFNDSSSSAHSSNNGDEVGPPPPDQRPSQTNRGPDAGMSNQKPIGGSSLVENEDEKE